MRGGFCCVPELCGEGRRVHGSEPLNGIPDRRRLFGCGAGELSAHRRQGHRVSAIRVSQHRRLRGGLALGFLSGRFAEAIGAVSSDDRGIVVVLVILGFPAGLWGPWMARSVSGAGRDTRTENVICGRRRARWSSARRRSACVRRQAARSILLRAFVASPSRRACCWFGCRKRSKSHRSWPFPCGF